MSKQEKHACLEAIQYRYRKANRTGKAKIPDEFCAVFSCHRKYAIRLPSKKPGAIARHPGRKPIYRALALLEALRRIWLASDQMCGKRLVAAIPLSWIPLLTGPDCTVLPTSQNRAIQTKAPSPDG